MRRKKKRILLLSDLHCGHEVGLTHPGFDSERPRVKRSQLYKVRRYQWDWFKETVNGLGRIDAVIVNGDAIDGKGEKSGGTEQLTTDRDEQVEMAVAAIKIVPCKKIYMSYGTAYHTGAQEDWEDDIAKEVDALKIGGEDTLQVNGLNINYRHFVSRSSIPHGRHTAIAKEKLWNGLWAERGEYPKADVIVRSHVHYHTYAGGQGWLALTTPALQGYGSKFGGRIVTGIVDYGMIIFDVYSKEDYSWEAIMLRMPAEEPIELGAK
jgi:hypothetical protein